jgi:3-oxoacyl-[acyl-carrier protein] reductase
LTEELIGQIHTFGTGSRAIAVQADLRETAAPKRVVQATIEEFGDNIDILVNNAGVDMFKALPDLTLDDYSAVFDVNVRATFLMCQAVVPYLRKPGRIINVSSVGARCGFNTASLYCATKAAVEGMTRGLAGELGSAGHTVNAVEPGPVESEMLEQVPPEIVEMQKKTTPVEHRVGKSEDITPVIAWLAQEDSRWISGQTISASGGYTML